jgi:hypothetical protein
VFRIVGDGRVTAEPDVVTGLGMGERPVKPTSVRRRRIRSHRAVLSKMNPELKKGQRIDLYEQCTG